MFENLKAFIRHGKNANEFKGHYPSISDPSLETSKDEYREMLFDDNMRHDSPATNMDLDDDVMNPKHSVETEKYKVSKTSGVDETQDIRDGKSDGSGSARAKNNNNNYEAATHIVEQERRQKKNKTEYPNLQNYEVLEQMGEGAFSIVYKARHVASDKFVAIKILRKFQMDQAQKQAVLKEVTIMRQLNHPNIVSFIEFIDSSDYYYIVQELAVGGEIFTAIVNYTYFSEDLARHVIVQVAHAIRYLHEEVGIVHRDIKPENLLYMPIEFRPSINPIAKLRKSDDPNSKRDEGDFVPGIGGGGIGVVKIADFGLSKQIWEHNTKTPCGTVGYTAPEIVRDERYSREVDMWAIGCVLYTLLCGFPPFYDERIETLTEKVAKGEYTFLSPWWDEISKEAKHCVSRLLTVDPLRRYSIDDFLNDPWILKMPVVDPAITSSRKIQNTSSYNYNHPIQAKNNKGPTYGNDEIYTPAAVALRDAFDISTAVHRMGEEAALSKGTAIPDIDDLIEENEDESVDTSGHVLNEDNYNRRAPRYTQQQQHRRHVKQQASPFDLNLGGASILERRKNKPVSVK
ncbi:uncharacterized protein AC631_02332 [Debaryomyces fabryi]|uniref:Protein kinase domain-containing protein n=1 Tax=Debaryomyces fabryi TaxID=58627 RepID=A0A0V1Q019_9ASCO|nr:uncharacterized protein AC631_02332 [Debaryomyces fabryi]KSA01876.1 hypothetical protein AC631_02332 [Debaryomyces fabryi]CUM53498.1 unnamed protein product [Debaryomyces fabryi]